MEDPPADLEAHERAFRWPLVRPEHFTGPFPAISGYVKRTREARAAVVDQALGMLGEGQRLAVHDEPERVDILFLDPGQEPQPGQTWTVYGPMVLDDQLDLAGRAAVAEPGPHPKAEEFQKLIDGLRNKQGLDDSNRE